MSSPRELDQSSEGRELGPRIRIRVIFQWMDKQATIVTSLQDDGCAQCDAFRHSVSITFERERFFHNTNGLYIRSMSRGGRGGKIRREQRYIEMPDQESISPSTRRFSSERLVVSPPSQHRRHIFSRILANRVINKVNSAPLVYKRQSSRPKPRSNAPSDVSRLGDL